MNIFKAFQRELESEVEKLVERLLNDERVTERQSHSWNRKNSKWSTHEETFLIDEVNVFIDTLALRHRRSRGGIVARLNKLLGEGRLCGLSSDAFRRSIK